MHCCSFTTSRICCLRDFAPIVWLGWIRIVHCSSDISHNWLVMMLQDISQTLFYKNPEQRYWISLRDYSHSTSKFVMSKFFFKLHCFIFLLFPSLGRSSSIHLMINTWKLRIVFVHIFLSQSPNLIIKLFCLLYMSSLLYALAYFLFAWHCLLDCHESLLSDLMTSRCQQIQLNYQSTCSKFKYDFVAFLALNFTIYKNSDQLFHMHIGNNEYSY